jgi:glycine oxidase
MILILGQGLAGTLLAWEFERAGVEFAIADSGHMDAASAVAAGIVNPITGQRLVPSWRVETLLPAARTAYRTIEAELGVRLWQEMRMRRLFANDRERAVFADKSARGNLGPYVVEADEAGFWIRDAARVDFRALLAASRARWERQGRLVDVYRSGMGVPPMVLRNTGGTPVPHNPFAGARSYDLVIDCSGAAIGQSQAFGFVPWEFSKGEILEIAVQGLVPDVVLNRRQWIVPIDPATAWVGATHEPGVRDVQPTARARGLLENAARGLLGDRPFTVTQQRAGVRVNLPDKRPVAGRHPENPRLGLINGLTAKGALWAPLLARQWLNHLTEGVPFDAEVEVRRFAM